MTVLYEDAVLSVDDSGVTLKRYYFPTGGAKRIEYSAIRGVEPRPMTWLSGKGRLWGTGHPGYWLPLDPKRPGKATMLVLDVGARIKPVISPDDPDLVLELLRARVTG